MEVQARSSVDFSRAEKTPAGCRRYENHLGRRSVLDVRRRAKNLRRHGVPCPYGTKINRRAIVMARAISERCLRRGGGGRRGLHLLVVSRRSAARLRGRSRW